MTENIGSVQIDLQLQMSQTRCSNLCFVPYIFFYRPLPIYLPRENCLFLHLNPPKKKKKPWISTPRRKEDITLDFVVDFIHLKILVLCESKKWDLEIFTRLCQNLTTNRKWKATT